MKLESYATTKFENEWTIFMNNFLNKKFQWKKRIIQNNTLKIHIIKGL